MKKRSFNARNVVMLGLFIAMEIVLSRFCSINAWNVKIGFAFLPVAVAGILFGPMAAGIVGGMGDFIGAILFPIGAYFPGFTLTAFLTGVLFGAFLHKKQTAGRVLGAIAINQLVLSLMVNTLWISILYQSPYGPLFFLRILQCAVIGIIQFFTIELIFHSLVHYRKRATA